MAVHISPDPGDLAQIGHGDRDESIAISIDKPATNKVTNPTVPGVELQISVMRFTGGSRTLTNDWGLGPQGFPVATISQGGAWLILKAFEFGTNGVRWRCIASNGVTFGT